jgi:hypothetical protein
MSLLPYALRPRVVLRKTVINRGVMGGSPLWRPIAMLMVGQGDYLKARAFRHGVFLGNSYWRAIGAAIIAQEVYKSVNRKAPDRIAVDRLRAGGRLQVAVSDPRLDLSRRQRRRELAHQRTQADAEVAARRS